ncbi:CBS domain-containing protein CBSCBSPB2 [Smittium mucronatum]|uniref:CBS domain-containing protein CBSCBSPB2 n=1 Tax=Smittium mucronatum TaxID=133383 RepID=A0A1R0GMM6_9FUNG|nr:CBS domain-containing protein CBSCBSPB2 [Smittium mucronatum]
MEADGLVRNLQPVAANSVKKGTSVLDAVYVMTAKKAYCLLVVDEDDGLTGIFTAKDVCFRMVAEGKSVSTTLVEDIVTPDPVTVTMQSLSIEALDIMVEKGFRHLPVSDEFGDIVGMLDILSCMYEGIESLSQNKNMLNDSETSPENLDQIQTYLQDAQDTLNTLQVGSILKEGFEAKVLASDSVFEASKLMKEAKSTCALVINKFSGAIVGILTTKDIILRVVAGQLDPMETAVEVAMTPHPDTISPNTLVMDALNQMHDKKYMNLPVVSNNGQISGVITVSELCRATLSLIDQRYTIPINIDFQNMDQEYVNLDYVGMNYNGNNEQDEYFQQYNPNFDPNFADYDHVDPEYSIDGYGAQNYGDENNSHLVNSTRFPQFNSLNDSVLNNSNLEAELGSQLSNYYQTNSSNIAFERVNFKIKSSTGKIYRFGMNLTANFTEFESIILTKLSGENENLSRRLKIEFLDNDGDYVILNNDRDLDAMITSFINSNQADGPTSSKIISLSVSHSRDSESPSITTEIKEAVDEHSLRLKESNTENLKSKKQRRFTDSYILASVGLAAASVGLVAFAMHKYSEK